MEARFVPCPPRTTAGAWTWRRQDLACAIINDATPKKIAAAKVTVSKWSQASTPTNTFNKKSGLRAAES